MMGEEAVIEGWGPSCPRAKSVPEVYSSCRLLIVPLFHGSCRFASLILSHQFRFDDPGECNEEEINDNDDDGLRADS